MTVTRPLSDDEIRELVDAHKAKELLSLQSLRLDPDSPEAATVKARIAALQAQLMNRPGRRSSAS